MCLDKFRLRGSLLGINLNLSLVVLYLLSACLLCSVSNVSV